MAEGPSEPPKPTEPTAATELAWEPSGTHRFAGEGDLLRWELHGPVLVEDVVELWRRNRQIRARYGYVLMLIDGTAAGTLVPEARRQIVDYKRNEPDSQGRVAVYGVGPLSRALVALVSRALLLVVKREVSVHLCASEGEAMAWLEGQRRILQAQLKPGTTNPLTPKVRSD